MLEPFTTLCALIRKSDLLQPFPLAGKTYLFLHLHRDQPASKVCPALWCHCREISSFQQLPFFHPFLFLSSVPMIHFPASPEINAGFSGSLIEGIARVFTSRLLNRGYSLGERVGALPPASPAPRSHPGHGCTCFSRGALASTCEPPLHKRQLCRCCYSAIKQPLGGKIYRNTSFLRLQRCCKHRADFKSYEPPCKSLRKTDGV